MRAFPPAPHRVMTARVMTALRHGVPLTLLADLLDEAGPDSREILALELGDLEWLRGLAYPADPAQPSDGCSTSWAR